MRKTLIGTIGILAGSLAVYSLLDDSPKPLTREERLEVHREAIMGQYMAREIYGDSLYNYLADAIRRDSFF